MLAHLECHSAFRHPLHRRKQPHQRAGPCLAAVSHRAQLVGHERAARRRRLFYGFFSGQVVARGGQLVQELPLTLLEGVRLLARLACASTQQKMIHHMKAQYQNNALVEDYEC